MHERAWINMRKTIICKAQKDSMKDTPIRIDPVWQILHTNTRYKALPDCIKKRCIKAKFKDIVQRGETFATVEYRDSIYGEKGPFYIEKKSCKIIAKKYLRSDQTEKYRLATEQEIEDYRYYPVYYFNKFEGCKVVNLLFPMHWAIHKLLEPLSLATMQAERLFSFCFAREEKKKKKNVELR